MQLHMPKYHDQLCKDMRAPHLRKLSESANPLAEVFMPYTARDYASLFEPAKPRAGAAPVARA